tara:strand:+ start:2842 stop:3075 length:234 start_codon:yes stop_codon:yes gene_type:complete
MERRARSVTHVEYEILDWIGRKLWLDGLMVEMVPKGDKVAEKRFRKGATNISGYLQNMMERRQHKLPKDHDNYKERE